MSILRRFHQLGNIYFIANVTYDRQPFLVQDAGLLLDSIESVRAKQSFDLHAWVILPDHFHFVIDPVDWDISKAMQSIKMSFGARYRKQLGVDAGRMWQNRFWDHIIRDQDDYNRHVDYVHYNPVKHGLVRSPFDWKWTSLHDYYREGLYRRDWGSKEIDWSKEDFGE